VKAEASGQSALDDLYWRDEILTAMFWLHGEGLAEVVDTAQLAQFLVADPEKVTHHLCRLADEGYLETTDDNPPHYQLGQMGRKEGGRRFHDEFAELQHQGHGECSADCICHDPAHAGEPCPSHSH
jgi:hypothetical protein